MYNSPRFMKVLLYFPLLLVVILVEGGLAVELSLPTNEKALQIINKKTPQLKRELVAKEFRFGSPVFIRIFKIPGELEVWLKKDAGFQLFKSYQVCDYSGFPGPKLYEGDWQSPEGFYRVDGSRMNPWSNYHLSFNLGFPNEYDRSHNRTGNALMVHGRCASMGCFAMTDNRMEEIYTLTHAALAEGQEAFSVHVFPFRMNRENMEKYKGSPWFSFWQNLKEGYDFFEKTKQVPHIIVQDGRYIIPGLHAATERLKR